MAEAPGGWHCVVVEHFSAGQGPRQHTKYRAQSSCGGPPQGLIFRFSQVDQLRTRLVQMPELQDVALPRLPPKATFRSLVSGRFDDNFLQERQGLLTKFFEDLASALNTKYAEVGNVAELCEPLAEFLAAASRAGDAAELEAVAAVEAAMRREEDRQIIATQNAEYEESLRQDELRRIEEAEKAEREQQAAMEQAKRQEEEAAQAREQEEALKLRREAFELAHPEPQAGEPQAMMRFRAPSGATLQRCFGELERVAVLFEFVALAEWDGPKTRHFDLRTSFPVTNLKGLESQSLRDAGLCPSATLLVAEET
ncbi:unnamed protein product [Durusdinium trenchii]|uniref:UBX domain-containing protein n=1 Tax=Durusdinium trenchii TaxID=1381693 RepID=A0ABP0LJ80_9DINO